RWRNASWTHPSRRRSNGGASRRSHDRRSRRPQWRNAMGLKWDDSVEIALRLLEQHPDVDPLAVRYTDLHRWVVEIADFDDDPKASNEGKLEAIQMAWLEESEERD